MKGYELYSWQMEGDWYFALVVGTNRIKTYDEISSPEVRVQGLAALQAKLDQLPGDEQVFWPTGRVPNTALPPAEIIEAVRAHCSQRGIQLYIELAATATPYVTPTPQPAVTPHSTPTPASVSMPTPYCRPGDAAVNLSASATSLQVGQTLSVTIILTNGEASDVQLGNIQYVLEIKPSGVLTAYNPEPLVHPLSLEPGRSDVAEFVLQAATPGRATLTGSTSFEIHPLDYSWGSWSGCRSEPLEIVVATPSILSFHASPAEIEPGATVTLTWNARAERAYIYELDEEGRLKAPAFTVPLSGNLVIPTNPMLRHQAEFLLFACPEDSDSCEQAQTSVAISCPDEWFFPDPPTTCPGPPHFTTVVAQRFERGAMLWLEAAGEIHLFDEIVVLYDDDEFSPRWQMLVDDWSPGMPENDPGIVPPAGYDQPVRGIGHVWREAPRVRDRLGWAIEEEFVVGDGAFQCEWRRYSHCYLTGPDDALYVLEPEMSGWSIKAPLPATGVQTPTPTLTPASPIPPSEGRLVFPTDAEPLLIDGEKGWLFVSAQVDDQPKTVKLSTTDGRLLGAYDVVGRLALDRTGERLIVDQGAAGVAILDERTGALQAMVSLPITGSAPAAPQVDPTTGLAYAFRDKTVYVIDPAAAAVVREETSSIVGSVCGDPWDDAPIARSFYDLVNHRLYLAFVTYVCTPWVHQTIVAYDASPLAELGHYETELRYQAVPFSDSLYGTTAGRLGRNVSWAWNGREVWFEQGDQGRSLQGIVADWGRQLVYEALDGQIWVLTPYPHQVIQRVDVPALAGGGRLIGHDPISDQLYFLLRDGQLEIRPTLAILPSLSQLPDDPLAAR
jgi:hypothetical protein